MRMLHSARRSVTAAKTAATRRSKSAMAAMAAMDDTAAGTYPTLFSPLDLGPAIGKLPNRALMGSMHTGLEGHTIPNFAIPWLMGKDKHHEHSDMERMARYFQERAEGGVGLMVTGGIAPNNAGIVAPFGSALVTHDQMVTHKLLTDAVHQVQVPLGYSDTETVPARICMQILHTGRYAYHPFCVSASATQSPISPFKAKALSTKEVETTIGDFVRCAVLAKEAGYDGVEIMGSEGYLLTQFLSPRTNQRTDEYGGSFENRARMALEIVRQTRQAVGQDFILIFRISLLDLVDDALAFDECVALAQQLQDAGATILNTGIGWHEARVPTIATSVPRGAFAFPTKALKEALGQELQIPLVATNRINDPTVAEGLLTDGTCDMVSMARPFLADAELMKKSREGRAEEINTCIGCNQACLDHVFKAKTASCLVNPRACHETELIIRKLPQEQCQNISVVGAGPAGCAFAITAAQMGHTVTLYDQADDIGGQFNMAKRIPGKEEFYETIRYFRVQLEKHGVQIKLGTKVTYEQMSQEGDAVDKWIVSTGVDPRDPQIPGMEGNPKVLSYIDVLRNKAPVGKKVALVGAGGIGFDVGEYLLHFDGQDKTSKDVSVDDFWKEWGIDTSQEQRGGLVSPETHEPKRELYLLQRKKGKLGKNLGKTTGWIHRATLSKGNVEMIDNVKYEKIDENGHLHISRDGEKRVLEVDNVVICAGQVERKELEMSAKGHEDLESKVYPIGGAFFAGELDAKRAIDMGTRLAIRIHEPDVTPGNHNFHATPGPEEKLSNLLSRFM
ncbi:Metal reductase [Seminavis robusta]|uniref:Metal reductase n=1 Tax=Seminavis robusta TaxID=568900 RepID=A0A9N8DJD8_9STRA|nr:Metal reductase [Seminavis robusta]|eukprot:Sro92_g047930.1 Metal reductase (789) ;mRNA; f:7414-9780